MAAATTGEQDASASDGTLGATVPGAAPARSDATGSPAAGELISAVAALLLLVVLLGLEWYGVAGVPDPSYARPAISTAENGWNGLTDVRWVILATVVAAIGSVLLHATQREHGVQTDTGGLVAALGALSSAALIYRVLISLPGNGRVLDQKLGAFLGLVCALGVTWGGWESISEQRARAAAGARRSRRSRRLDARRARRSGPGGRRFRPSGQSGRRSAGRPPLR